jgi:hypothetical protein
MAVRKPTKRAISKRRAVRAPRKKRELTIWEQIIELGKRIPPEELATFPPDGATNLDHYLYGTPKQEP